MLNKGTSASCHQATRPVASRVGVRRRVAVLPHPSVAVDNVAAGLALGRPHVGESLGFDVHRGRGSGKGRPKTSPRYLASQVARCLTKPSRLVPGEGQRTTDVVLGQPVEFGKHRLALVLHTGSCTGWPSQRRQSWDSTLPLVPQLTRLSTAMASASRRFCGSGNNRNAANPDVAMWSRRPTSTGFPEYLPNVRRLSPWVAAAMILVALWPTVCTSSRRRPYHLSKRHLLATSMGRERRHMGHGRRGRGCLGDVLRPTEPAAQAACSVVLTRTQRHRTVEITRGLYG